MPRPIISSASSRWVHWLMGRSESAGISQPNATIWQICSGVIRAGRPDLGASANRSTTFPGLPRQRARHSRTASESRCRRRATSSVLRPSAAKSTMRARTTTCCPVVRARTKRSSSFRSSCVSEISGGFGPGMSDTSHRKMLKVHQICQPETHPPAYIRLTVLAEEHRRSLEVRPKSPWVSGL